MRDKIQKMYGALAILLMVIFVYSLFNLRLSILRDVPLADDCYVTKYVQSEVKDASASLGFRERIQFQIPEIHEDYNSLVFYTRHENVKVYLGGKVLYSVEAQDGCLMPKSPGCQYHQITFRPEWSGLMLRIELEPVYSRTPIPSFMFGSRYAILKGICRAGLPTVLLCLFTILLGILILVFSSLSRDPNGNRDSKGNVRSLRMLACLSVVMGFWKLVDSNLAAVFTARIPVLSILPYFALLLMPYLAVETIRGMVGEETDGIWDIPYALNIIAALIMILMQATRTADLRQNLWLVQAAMVGSVFCVGIGIYQLIRQYGMTRKIKRGLLGAGCCAVWMVLDMLTYYISQGFSTFPLSILAYDAFALIIVGDYLGQSRKMMAEGMQARRYEKLAYHDTLTGFYNRTAYAEYLGSPDFVPEGCVVVNIDLNDLKKCNDRYGHDKGDIYIRESAIIIHDCFSEGGRCYRLGGDEFGVILCGCSLDNCRERVEAMHRRVEEFNLHTKDFTMGIACGYAMFDRAEDGDIHDTVRRADKRMYEDKFRMKQGRI